MTLLDQIDNAPASDLPKIIEALCRRMAHSDYSSREIGEHLRAIPDDDANRDFMLGCDTLHEILAP